MVADAFGQYLDAINRALAGGDATEHTHRPALKVLVEAFLSQEPESIKTAKDLAVRMAALAALHLMEAAVLEDEGRWPGFPAEGSMMVEAGYPKYVADAERAAAGRVYINKDQYFEAVRPEVWGFHVGGYQVCEKWLKDRRERTLSYSEVNRYQKVVVALDETLRLMGAECMTGAFVGGHRRDG